jgi:tRNA1Val (adenine37-N6)-methyltransferase
VTTDSVLLGSWVRLAGVHKVLDVGCGSGILSLMIAQRTPENCAIIGIDHHKESIHITTQNFLKSAWEHKLSALRLNVAEINEYSGIVPFSKHSFHLVISNPPYFDSDLKSPVEMKSRARHQSDFNFEALVRFSATYLEPGGKLVVVIPSDLECKLTSVSIGEGLYLNRKCTVKHFLNSEPGLCLCEYGSSSSQCEFSELILFEEEQLKTPAYHELTRDFYL